MKNFVFVIVGILFSAVLGMTISAYALSTQDEITERILTEAGINKTYSSDTKELKKLSTEEDMPFKNLYLFMYQNVLWAPQDSAIAEIAKWTEYSEDDLKKIVIDGDVTPIIDNKQAKIDASAGDIDALAASQEEDKAKADETMESFISANDFSAETEAVIRNYYTKYAKPSADAEENLNLVLTQEVVKDEYTYIVDAYQEEFELQRSNRKLGYQALASEMFINNDLSDSANIDLLYDLDMIHYVLFGDYITYPDRSGGDSVDLASLDEDTVDEAVVLSEDTASPYACTGDSELEEAITAFEEAPTDTVRPGSGLDLSVIIPWRDGLTGSAETVSDDGTSDTVTKVQASLESLSNFISQLEGQKGDFSRSLPCGDIFCITVDLVTETEDPAVQRDYTESDDCITCHLTFINKYMTETLSHSLVPGKLSMNWFEDATCKGAGTFLNLDFNVYAIKKPIDLDPGDETDDAPKEDTDALKTKLFTVAGFPLPGGSDNTFKKTLSDMACESILNLYDVAGTGSTLEEVQKRCIEASNQITATKTEAYQEYEFSADTENLNTMYTQVSAELYTMLSYFEGFKSALEATYLIDQAPLKSLNNKTYCGG